MRRGFYLGYLDEVIGIVRAPAEIARFFDPIALNLGLAITSEISPAAPLLFEPYLSLSLTRSPHNQVASYRLIKHSFHRGRRKSIANDDTDMEHSLTSEAIAHLQSDAIIGSATFRYSCAGELVDIYSGVQWEALWTNEFAATSQFENEIRAAYDLPLGSSASARDWALLEFSAPRHLDMVQPYLHLFAHDANYKICKLSSHAGFVTVHGEGALADRAEHAVDYLEGVIKE